MGFPDDLVLGAYNEAAKLLEYAVESALQRQIDLPSRQYVTQGQAVHECEQVVATMVTVTTGLPGANSGGPSVINACPLPWRITVELAIVRCQVALPADDGTPPNTSKLLADARQAAADTLILQDAADARAAEQFGGVSCTITYPPPSGGFFATSASYQVAIST